MNALENCVPVFFRKISATVLVLAFLFSGLAAKATTEYHYFEEFIYPQVGYYVSTLTVSYSPDVIIDCEAEFLDPTIDDLKLTVEISNDGLYAYIHLSRTDDTPFDGTEAAPEVGIGSMAVVDLGKTHSSPQISFSHSRPATNGVMAVASYPNPVAVGNPIQMQWPLGTRQVEWVEGSTGKVTQSTLAPDGHAQEVPSPQSAGVYRLLYRGAEGELLGYSTVVVLD
jgi:hypothetical protein